MNESTNKLKIFASRVIELREASELSQLALANKIGLESGGTVNKWEKGGGFPEVQTLIQLASALNSSVAVLLGEDELPKHGGALEKTIREIVKDEMRLALQPNSSGEDDAGNAAGRVFSKPPPVAPPKRGQTPQADAPSDARR